MKRINGLSDLLIEEMSKLLDAENRLIEALVKIAPSEPSALRSALEDYLDISRDQVARLKDIFSYIRQNPQGVSCETMKGFMIEMGEVENNTEKYPDSDAAIISVLQRVTSYQMEGYKRAREHAADLGHARLVELFTKTLNELRAMNFHLNELAQGMINAQATETKSTGFYIPEGKFSRKITKKNRDTGIPRYINEGNPDGAG